MEKSDIISVIALVVSLVSAGYTIYFGLRDRAKLKTKCYTLDTPQPSFRVKAVNTGRRVVTLDGFGVRYSNGSYWIRRFETYEMRMVNDVPVEKEEHGRRLEEHDYFEETVSADHDFYNHAFSSGNYPVSLWLQDTAGKEYKIRHSDKYLAEINKHFEYVKIMKPDIYSDKKPISKLTKQK
jgi:hypothetical protein